MPRRLRLLALGALMLGVTAIPPVGGVQVTQTFGAGLSVAATGNSGIQIQNLSTTSSATVVLSFYPQSGGGPYDVAAPPIPAGGNVTIWVPSQSAVPSGFVGSVVISSDQPVAAIAQTTWSNNQGADSYTGFDSGNASFFMPLVLHSWVSTMNTNLTVQNTGSSNANVTVKLYRVGQTSPTTQYSRSITPGASYTWDQTSDANLGSAFIGSALVSADQPVAAIGSIRINDSPMSPIYYYKGFAAGGTQLAAPLVRRNYYGTTGIQVQNTSTSQSTNVTVNYTGRIRNTGSVLTYSETKNIGPLSAWNFWQGGNLAGGGSLPDGFIGAASVTSSGGIPIVGMVNDELSSTGSYHTSAAYSAVPNSSATTKILTPLVRNNHTANLLTTGVQVMNVGSADAHVTVTYAGSPSWGGTLTSAQTTDTATVAAGTSKTFWQGGPYLKNSSITLPAGFYGSATITSDQPILAIVNDASNLTPPGQDASMYNGLNTN